MEQELHNPTAVEAEAEAFDQLQANQFQQQDIQSQLEAEAEVQVQGHPVVMEVHLLLMVLLLLVVVEVDNLLETLVDLAVVVETTLEAEALEVVVHLVKEILEEPLYLLVEVEALAVAVEKLLLVNLLLVHHMVEMAALVNQLQ